ncbi:SEFIR domain-containing protein [Pectobacterium aroidearum]|uniref:SEFIR domain-containing protein n=1 Tax=Pectobacterium aroidearum TaxID=1201031 RepID=UPI00260732E1|nr:SEFIR domain-containing protein [Pectobacterium aroidearum]WKA61060.1 TIR domain-containing protein [Pectobacterium aroidearum]
MIEPKVFISYSWSSKTHQQHIKSIVERLATDGVESVVDIYDLKEGDDKNHYMERMVTDDSVTHVLVICDNKYSDKADKRKAGVGTESIIISQEIYSKVSQSKFIPLVFEFNDDNEPCVPLFLKSRIYIDFSTLEKENENWERLIRLLYGKPEFVKPQKGKPPAYLEQKTSHPSYAMNAKFQSLKTAINNQNQNIKNYRRDFISVLYSYCDYLRPRESPNCEDFSEYVVQTHKELLPARDLIVDWVLFEGANQSEEFTNSLIDIIEKLIELKGRPENIGGWNDVWYLAHGIFSYETVLYIIAALTKIEAFDTLHDILHSSYLLPLNRANGYSDFCNITDVYCSSDFLQKKLSPENYTLHSPVAELIKLSASRSDVNFDNIKQADLIILMISFIKTDLFWFPQILLYAGHYEKFPLFVRAAQRKGFKKIAKITGINEPEILKEKLIAGEEIKNIDRSSKFLFGGNFIERLNVKNMNTID